MGKSFRLGINEVILILVEWPRYAPYMAYTHFIGPFPRNLNPVLSNRYPNQVNLYKKRDKNELTVPRYCQKKNYFLLMQEGTLTSMTSLSVHFLIAAIHQNSPAILAFQFKQTIFNSNRL